MSGKKPLSKQGELWEMVRNAREKKNKQVNLNRIKERRPAFSKSRLNESGYIAENGLDRQDAKLKRENPAAFRKQVDDFILNNEMRRMKEGKGIGIYKPIYEAQRRGDEQKKKRNGGK